MRALIALTLPFALGGCFFVYIPGSVVTGATDALTGQHGNYCVPAAAKLGDRIRLPDGSYGIVEKLEGTSYRCKNEAKPIRARVA
jgi:hypothetical protein